MRRKKERDLSKKKAAFNTRFDVEKEEISIQWDRREGCFIPT